MKTTVVAGIVVTVAIVGLAAGAAAQDDDGGIGRQEAGATADSTAWTKAPAQAELKAQYQTGVFTQIAGDPLLSGNQKWLVSLDFTFSRYNRNGTAWGFGLHAGIDEATGRFGPKLVWRAPLSKGGLGYFQISPGIYIVGDDDLEWTSGFLEAELGYSNSIALVAIVERLSYGESANGTGGGYNRTAGYVGMKLGDWPGLAATAGLLAVAATALASMDF